MFSIGHFAKLAKVSPRTVRHYEAVGLLKSSPRGQNGYRQFDQAQLEKLKRIRDLQELGFSLKEIKKVLQISSENLTDSLAGKLQQVSEEIASLQTRRSELERLLSISTKIDKKKSINDIERKQYMSIVREEILNGLQSRFGSINEQQLRYVARDEEIYQGPAMAEFINAIKKCVAFAKSRNLLLGPGRGSAPSSIVFYALGLNNFDPSKYDLIPERMLSTMAMDIHIDVEFERGQEFVDYCRQVSQSLSVGQINAFKMPLLDIMRNVRSHVPNLVDTNAVPDDSDVVLHHFRSGQIEKIFGFDLSPHALIMKYENLFPQYLGIQPMREYLRSQTIRDFRDVINITAIWRPHHSEIVHRMERYRQAKAKKNIYDFLDPVSRASLDPNFGLAVYHEDLLRILHHATGWSLAECNRLRKGLAGRDPSAALDELQALVSPQIYDLVVAESPWAFCQPHSIAFSYFTKQMAILKSLHQDLYLREIQTWEQKHGFAWDDIGVKMKGISLLQN